MTWSRSARRTLLFAVLVVSGVGLACSRRTPEDLPAPPRIEPAPPVTRPAVASAAAPAGPSAPPPPPAVPVDHELCRRMCEASAALHCKAAMQCESHCEDLQTLDVCADVVRAALGCFGRLGSEAWECDPEGVPSLKKGYCEAEQTRVDGCLAAKQAGP